MTILRPNFFRHHLERLRKHTLWLAACTWSLQTLLAPALIGTTLMAVAPAAHASCSYTGDSGTSGTYTYTSANITSAATLDLQGTWVCYDNGSAGSNRYICYMANFTGSATGSNTGSLAYTASLYRSNGGSSATTLLPTSATSQTWYGPANTPSPNMTKLRFTVPAGTATTGTAVGTYTATATLNIDEQQNSAITCEKSTSSWDSGTVSLTGYFVMPSICTLVTTAATLDFGNLNIGPLAAATSATTTLTVNCNNYATYTVYLGDGNYRVSTGSGLRQMANGTARLPYQLYQDSGYSTVWDATGMGSGVISGSGGVTQTATGSNQNLTVYGRIAQGTNIPATTGTYSDYVVITVAY